ncbi:Surfeit locus protein, putative [Pediculus humanus corporis]|uniref:SURF1-like protein n=1 Tax=Pediculus humanus subsp. corporis TaxID=121224 RepID=E0VED3_PEDHC|nr:Surfeit locus protein, putative [Pediculus humanus corporis]EEB11739.1 Surfeit locus protein, putative [Pediculus humanus corporis]
MNLLIRVVAAAPPPSIQEWRLKRKKRFKPNKTGSLFLLTIPVIAFGLGTWQIKRKFEKNEQIKELRKKVDLPPIPLPKNFEELNELEYRKVKVKGKFDHSKEIYLGPITLLGEHNLLSGFSSLLSTARYTGYQVITPFKLSDRKETILVNRGWIPKVKKSPQTRLEGQIDDEVELIGLIRLSEKRPPLGRKNDPEHGRWLYRDIEKMSEIAGTSQVLIDADISTEVTNGPIAGQTNVTLPDNHLTYIVTWYGVCISTSYMWYLRLFSMCFKNQIYEIIVNPITLYSVEVSKSQSLLCQCLFPKNLSMLFYSFFKSLVGKDVVVELKNDLSICGTLHSVDQYLNIKLTEISVTDPDKYPHMLSIKNCFIRGSVVRYVQLPADEVDTQLLQDAARKEAASQSR